MTEIIMGLVGTWVSGVIYAIRQEGRINLHDKRHDDHEKRFEELRGDTENLRSEMREDLDYIRNRIDAALNGRHH